MILTKGRGPLFSVLFVLLSVCSDAFAEVEITIHSMQEGEMLEDSVYVADDPQQAVDTEYDYQTTTWARPVVNPPASGQTQVSWKEQIAVSVPEELPMVAAPINP